MLVADAPAWKVIWPFLADSIAMAVVESAIEDVDNAMDDYVTQLQFWGQEKKNPVCIGVISQYLISN